MTDLFSQMKTVDLMLKFLRGDLRHITCYPFTPQKREPLWLSDNRDLPRSTPEAEGIPSSYLRDFFRELDTNPLVCLHGAIVLRHGKVIAEGSWKPYTPSLPHMMFSLSKSVVSMAVGFAVQEGLLRLDEKVVDIFPDRLPLLRNSRMNNVTVEHLLTMTSGVRFNEAGSAMERDWVRGFLQSDCAFEPGTQFAYDSMNSYLLSAIVCRRSGKTLMEYLEPRLFRPLNIRGISWDTCPMGIEKGGWGLSLRLADMAKLGQLYLQDGVWAVNGVPRRVLPKGWVKDSIRSRRPGVPEKGTNAGYGYQIWTFEAEDAYQFNGMFGQYVVVLPARDMVIGISSGSQNLFSDDSLGVIAHYFGDGARGISDSPLPPNPREESSLRDTLGQLYVIRETAPKPPKFPPLPHFIRQFLPERKGSDLSEWGISGKVYRLQNDFGTLMPTILQCVTNNFCAPLSHAGFLLKPRVCRVFLRDADDSYKIEAGLDGTPRTGTVSFHSEVYAVGATARLARDEDGRTVLKLFLSFLETPCTRVMKCIFYGEKILIRFDEIPNLEKASDALFEVMEGESGGLQKLLSDTITRERLTRRLDRLLHPRAKGMLVVPARSGTPAQH